MDYIMKINITTDTETKKNTIRDNLKTQLTTAHTAGTVKSWGMDISGVIVEAEDHEEYSS